MYRLYIRERREGERMRRGEMRMRRGWE